MASNAKTHEELRSELIDLATEDEQFRAHLIANPKAAIQDALGIQLPESLSVTVYEDSATNAHLVLPPRAKLTDEDLEQVAAGHVRYITIYKLRESDSLATLVGHRHDANGRHI